MKLQIITILNLLLCCVLCDDKSDNDERRLSVTVNPGCEEQIGSECERITFVHVEAKSDVNTIHHIWDFTGSPSLFLARTDNNATLGIDWYSFMRAKSNSVNFSSEPELIFSSVIKTVLLFNDVDDKADVSHKTVTEVTSIDTHNFSWELKNLTHEDDHVMLVMSAGVGTNGSFTVKVTNLMSKSQYKANKIYSYSYQPMDRLITAAICPTFCTHRIQCNLI